MYQDFLLDSAGLIRHIRRNATQEKGAIIAQRRVKNHPTPEPIGEHALVLLRIVTLCAEADMIRHLMSVPILPIGKKTLRPDFVLAPVDGISGVPGRAVPCGWTGAEYVRHPDTGAPIAGRILTFWKEALETAMRAHTHYAGYFSLGWGVAITEQGPAILEANTVWDGETMQKPHDLPLGETAFRDLCLNRIAFCRSVDFRTLLSF